MANSFPPEVLVFDINSIVVARFDRGRTWPKLVSARKHRLETGTFVPGPVTPILERRDGLLETARRIAADTSKGGRISVLLPDAWFRINILEFPSLPDNHAEAQEMIRWSLKRTLPIKPEEMRLGYEILQKSPTTKVLAVAALDKTLAEIEVVFLEAGLEIILIEPEGINLWNAVAVRESATQTDRIFFYMRETDFTTILFRGNAPLFIRSRNLSGERTLSQELRLSASYLRSNIEPGPIDACYVAGNGLDRTLLEEIASEFAAPVKTVASRDFLESSPAIDTSSFDAELTACTGVFTT